MNTKITMTQASQKLNISPHSVKRWIQQGKLNGEKLKGKWYVIADETFEHHQHIRNGNPDKQHHTNSEHHDHTNSEHQTTSDSNLHTENEYLKAFISVKDKQIQSLLEQLDRQSQLLAVAHKSLQQVSEQYQLLTDYRKSSFWRRLFGRSQV